jgi:hypothetical protein
MPWRALRGAPGALPRRSPTAAGASHGSLDQSPQTGSSAKTHLTGGRDPSYTERQAILAARGANIYRHSRRQLLQGSLALAGLSLLSGCEMPGQQAAKVRRIGFLAVGSREGRAFLIEGLLQGLREHGYVEGQNIVIEYRFSEGRNDRLPELAAELVARKVELILASGSPASSAAKQATSTIRSSWEASTRIRSRPVLSPAWRARAATSRGLLRWPRSSAGNGYSCSRRSCRAFRGWLGSR